MPRTFRSVSPYSRFPGQWATLTFPIYCNPLLNIYTLTEPDFLFLHTFLRQFFKRRVFTSFGHSNGRLGAGILLFSLNTPPNVECNRYWISIPYNMDLPVDRWIHISTWNLTKFLTKNIKIKKKKKKRNIFPVFTTNADVFPPGRPVRRCVVRRPLPSAGSVHVRDQTRTIFQTLNVTTS